MVDILVCKAKGYVEGNHFSGGFGSKLDVAMEAVERMKRTSPKNIDFNWCTAWERRTSQLTGASFWVRRGSFPSPIEALLPDDAKTAAVWELRGSPPPECDDINTSDDAKAYTAQSGEEAGLMLPSETHWFGFALVDKFVDFIVRRVNARTNVTLSTSPCLGDGVKILLLPDFGGEYCKRTLPIAELVACELPRASILMLEMPLRGTRKPKGYVGSIMPTLQDMTLMGCAVIEESRSLLRWFSDRGHSNMSVAGVSMGAHMAVLTACCSTNVSSLALLMPSHSAEANWIDGGVMGMNREMGPEEMRQPLWESTNVEAYPKCTSVNNAVVVAARADGYVPLWSSMRLTDYLERMHVKVDFRTISGGHVGGFLAHQLDFARAVIDTVTRPTAA
eukprot:TRINITY_DN73545_c0_g1_i1.p1 TRINITY_DN73545_c0_g1~~TRINITY_DN73545_c0_g1_i1.p1  ORF type:complete len:446 (+),score=58.09 TRINITY_DN73545_c0_g1_i1:168-1340(+)